MTRAKKIAWWGLAGMIANLITGFLLMAWLLLNTPSNVGLNEILDKFYYAPLLPVAYFVVGDEGHTHQSLTQELGYSLAIIVSLVIITFFLGRRFTRSMR